MVLTFIWAVFASCFFLWISKAFLFTEISLNRKIFTRFQTSHCSVGWERAYHFPLFLSQISSRIQHTRRNPICIGASAGSGNVLLRNRICVRVFGVREGAFVYPKLDFEALVIELQVRQRGWSLISLKATSKAFKDIVLSSSLSVSLQRGEKEKWITRLTILFASTFYPTISAVKAPPCFQQIYFSFCPEDLWNRGTVNLLHRDWNDDKIVSLIRANFKIVCFRKKMWSSVTAAGTENGPAPPSRSKHSATLLAGHVYLLGGRNGNLPLKDLWRYSLGKW